MKAFRVYSAALGKHWYAAGESRAKLAYHVARAAFDHGYALSVGMAFPSIHVSRAPRYDHLVTDSHKNGETIEVTP